MAKLDGNKHVVAVIDGDRRHREELSSALLSYYSVESYTTGEEALSHFKVRLPGAVIIGEEAGKNSAVEVITRIRKHPVIGSVPILVTVSPNNGAVLDVAERECAKTLLKPYRRSVLIKVLSTLLNDKVEESWELLSEQPRKALKLSVRVFNQIADVLASGETLAYTEVKESCRPLLSAVANKEYISILEGVKSHDDYTYAHSMRVATLLSLFGHSIGFTEDEQLLLASGGLLHDVGKMAIPHEILNKPGKLEPSEFEIMKSHVAETMKYLKASGDIHKAVMIIAEQHHEKLNGMGYPHGLRGSQLNELARMSAIVDVFSALTDRRVYKPAMDPVVAFRIMTQEMTDHLDQRYVKVFRDILGDAGILAGDAGRSGEK